MCKALTELIEDGKQEGIALTKKVYKFYYAGVTEGEIAERCKISVEEVQKILE